MRLECASSRYGYDQKVVHLDTLIGKGGEASVYEMPDDPSLVAKVYHTPTEGRVLKLAVMLGNPPAGLMAADGHTAIAWPVDLLLTTDGIDEVVGLPPRGYGFDDVVGFVMPRVPAMRPVVDFYNPKTRREQCPLFHYQYLIHTGRNLATAMAAIHEHGYVIGDVNESNVRVSETALVTLLDTDSFQVTDPDGGWVYRCGVGKPEFTPPELQGQSFARVDRTPAHDRFGLAVLLFQLLMEGRHPFAGLYTGRGEPPPLEARIAAGHYPDSAGKRVPYRPALTALAIETLHPPLRQMLRRCFEDGQHDPALRPDAREWANALSEAEAALATCPANDQHRYGNHLASCPWCARAAQLGGRDPFPSRQAVTHGLHRQPDGPPPGPSSPDGQAAAGQLTPPSAYSGHPGSRPSPHNGSPAPAIPASSAQQGQRAWLPMASGFLGERGGVLGAAVGASWCAIWGAIAEVGRVSTAWHEKILGICCLGLFGCWAGGVAGVAVGTSAPYLAVLGAPTVSGWGFGAAIGLTCRATDACAHYRTGGIGAAAGLACGIVACVHLSQPGGLKDLAAALGRTAGRARAALSRPKIARRRFALLAVLAALNAAVWYHDAAACVPDQQGPRTARPTAAAEAHRQTHSIHNPASHSPEGRIAVKQDALITRRLGLLSKYAAEIRWFQPKLSEATAWRLAEDITTSSVTHGLDARLLLAVLAVETHFDRDKPLERGMIHFAATDLKECLGVTPPTWKKIKSALTERYKASPTHPDGCDGAAEYVLKVGRLYYQMCGLKAPE